MARVGEVGGTSTTVSIIILLIIMITTVTTMVGYSATLNPSENASTSGTCQGLHIASVTRITTDTNGTITIKGCGFGSNPQLVNNTIAGDGSVDTVQSQVTPSIAFFRGLTAGGATSSGGSWTWEAGFANTPGAYDTIGLYIASWRDNTIVIHGFGAYLGTGGQKRFNLANGDNITIVIVGPDCAQSTYNFPPFPATCSTQYSTIVGGT
jgi:hypothetical protein